MKVKTKSLLSKLMLLLIALVTVTAGLVGIAAPAQAATGNILPPFDVGQSWCIYQGYNQPNATHHDNGPYSTNPRSMYGLDLTGADCGETSAAGRTVRAPLGGTASYSSEYGNMCINTTDGRSIALTHINSSIPNGPVSAGQVIGSVAAAGQKKNNGVAHIHLQIWSSSGCWATGNGGMPFDSAHNAQICGVPNLIANGTNGSNGTWSGTQITGATCSLSVGYTMAFQANTANLFTFSSVSGGSDLQQGMRSGTSPTITTLTGGGYQTAIQANTGHLIVYGAGGNTYIPIGMMAGTSPAITALGNGNFVVAFQANTGELWTYSPATSGVNHHFGMMAGTSPAITTLGTGNYVVAFQANTGALWTYSPATGGVNNTIGMKSGTSPAITALGTNNYVVAFQANTGDLWTYSPATGGVNLQQGMMAGTSPAITTLNSGGYQAAFQANTGNLAVYGSAGTAYLSMGMMAGTSPAITAQSNGSYTVALHANTGELWSYSPAVGGTNLQQGMMAGTSPAITK